MLVCERMGYFLGEVGEDRKEEKIKERRGHDEEERKEERRKEGREEGIAMSRMKRTDVNKVSLMIRRIRGKVRKKTAAKKLKLYTHSSLPIPDSLKPPNGA